MSTRAPTLALSLALTLIAGTVSAQSGPAADAEPRRDSVTGGSGLLHQHLPDIGSSAGELISPAEERRYGARFRAEMRRLGLLIEDPLLDDWIQSVGQRLAAHSATPNQEFTFFLLGSRQINAFATLGGTIGTNAGLILTAEREDELAAVLAHEIAHVTQRHIVRSVESASKDALPITLAMLGALIAAQKADSADASQAAIAGGMALMQQRQINYTRANEHEADRIGIQLLARAGYDPMAMADFFARMHRATRAHGYDLPELLRSHPVTTTRISEAKDRAGSVCSWGENGPGVWVQCGEGERQPMMPRTTSAPLHPGLPSTLHASLGQIHAPLGADFPWARERIRVLSARNAGEARAEYLRRLAAGDALGDPELYGLALAHLQLGDGAEAVRLLTDIEARHPDRFWLDLALAEAEYRAGRAADAQQRFERLLVSLPRNRAVVLAYASMLTERGAREDGLRAQAALRPLLDGGSRDPLLHAAFGRASELAGDLVRAGEAHADAAFHAGRAEDALNLLQRLKQQHALDYVQRARIDARIAAITPVVLELRAEGIRAGRPAQPLGRGAALLER